MTDKRIHEYLEEAYFKACSEGANDVVMHGLLALWNAMSAAGGAYYTYGKPVLETLGKKADR
jgi:hypothetical protein